jgi:hypothetical protein
VSIVSGGEAGYPSGDYYAFDFVATKTANWTCSRWRRLAHAALALVCDVDGVRVPVALEWPHAFVAGGIAILALGLNAIVWLR